MAIWQRRATATAAPSSVPSAPGWTQLPALQRVVEPIEPIAPREPFVASLASHHSPSFLAPLAHVIDPAGPSGRIAGLITAAPQAPTPPVQRSAPGDGSVIKRFITRPRSTPVITSAAPVQRKVAADVAAPEAVEVYAEPEHAVAPESIPEQIEVRLPEPTPPDNPGSTRDTSEPTTLSGPMPAPALAPRSAPLAAATPAVQRAVGDAPAAHRAPATPQPVAAPTRTAASAASVAEAPAASAVQRTAAVDAQPMHMVSAVPEPQPSTPASPPRLQRAMTDATPPLVLEPIGDAISGPQPAASIALPEPRSSDSPQSRRSDNRAAAEPARVQRSVAPAPTPATSASASASAPAPAPAPALEMKLPAPRTDALPDQPAGAPTELAAEPESERGSRPLLGAIDDAVQLVASPAPVQRLDSASPPAWTLSTPPHPVQGPHRTAQDDTPNVQTARPLGFGPPLTNAASAAPSVRTAPESAPVPAPLGPVSLSQWSAGRAAIPAVQRAGSVATHELTAPVYSEPETVSVLGDRVPDIATGVTHAELAAVAPALPMPRQAIAQPPRAAPPAPAVQRTLGMGAPLPASPATMSAPIRQLQREVAGDRSPAPSYWDAGSVAVAAGIAQRGPHGSVEFGAAPPLVQRDADDTPAPPEPAAAPEPATSPAPSAAPAPPAAVAAAPAGGQNIDDLVRRLYDPLAARLKAELRLDRERAGLVTDLRRP